MPRSRNAAPVIRRGPPNRPAQPLVHRDSPSVGMGSKGILAGTRHRWRRGCWPRRRVPQQLAPACPGSPRKQMSGACFRRWGSGRGRYPAGKHVPQRDGDLKLCRCLWTLSPAPSAALSWLRYPLCSRCPPDANTGGSRPLGRESPQETAGVHYCPPQIIQFKNVTQVTCAEGDRAHLQCRPPVGRGAGDWQLGLSYLARILDRVGRAKRRSSPRAKRAQPNRRQQTPAQPPGQAQAASRMRTAQVLEQIECTRIAQQRAEASLAKLVNQAVGLGIGWPEIAARLGVTRQAARQHYQRRHRDSETVQDRRS